MVKNWNVEGWRKQGIAVTRDSRSRMEGKKQVLSKVKVGLVRKLERFKIVFAGFDFECVSELLL